MKLTKLSLVAMLLIGSSAFAIENTKISGDAQLYYGTQDSDANNAPDMFDEAASYTNFAARLDLTTDLTKGVSAGVGMQIVATFGVENNMVDNTWSGAHSIKPSRGSSFAGGLEVEPEAWIDELWLAGTAYDTTLKLGRQALDTPLAFSETWGVDKNTFEAGVLINQSLPDTTIIATFIGKSNGSADEQSNTLGNGLGADYVGTNAAAGYVAGGGKFSTFGKNGTYAYGLINNSFKPLTVQAWYYDMSSLAQAYWLQADLNLDGLLVGGQFANTDAESLDSLVSYLSSDVTTDAVAAGIADVKDTTMYSVMLGYEVKDVVTVKVAYSSVSDDGTLGMANTATGVAATLGGQSKMYTEMWWNYGNVSAVGSDSYSITAETTVGPKIDLYLGYFFSDINPDANSNTVASIVEKEISEITITASKKFGPLSTSIALIYADVDYDETTTTDTDVKTTDLQVYLTYNF